MADKTIIYGEILGEEHRRQIVKAGSDHPDFISWRDDTTFPQNGSLPENIFVDLDDARFSTPEFLMSIATSGEQVKIIGKSDNPNIDETIRVSKLGVAEVLTPEQCLQRLHSFLEELKKDCPPAEEKSSQFAAEALIGCSSKIIEIRNTAKILSEVDFPSALILGETGTGKGLIARILHNSGLRSDHNMVEVNCSAIPDELFESELFGHTKGAFTDAKTEKVGLFEYAQDGTIFLDEVGNLSSSAQAKLLKILEDKKLRKIGAIDETKINVRVVAATNCELQKNIENGSFREDLFYRLNLLTIEIPPLRERPEDISGLVDHYLTFYSAIYGKPDIKMSPKAVVEMNRYSWPGNVRELCNVIERTVLLNRGNTVKPQDIRKALNNSRLSIGERRQIKIDIPPQGVALDEVEQKVVSQVLNMFNWNKTETARFLKISRPRLRRIIENAGLEQNRRQR